MAINREPDDCSIEGSLLCDGMGFGSMGDLETVVKRSIYSGGRYVFETLYSRNLIINCTINQGDKNKISKGK